MSYRFICSECKKPHWRQVTEIDTFSSCCDAPIVRVVKKYEARADQLAKKQLRTQELEYTRRNKINPLRAHDYPYYFGRKTFK